jgi:hypothetical protein
MSDHLRRAYLADDLPTLQYRDKHESSWHVDTLDGHVGRFEFEHVIFNMEYLDSVELNVL